LPFLAERSEALRKWYNLLYQKFGIAVPVLAVPKIKLGFLILNDEVAYFREVRHFLMPIPKSALFGADVSFVCPYFGCFLRVEK